jgi:glutamyl-tRNA synthetase
MKTRFAPSPSGDLHLGNARTALFSWLLARKLGGVFLLRIEDTDQTRSSTSSTQGIIDDLRWLGLAWDEGPERGGPHAPYRQSERGAIYEEQFQHLGNAGVVYPCFCSPETLAIQRKTQAAAGKPPRYAGTCAVLSAAESQARRTQGQAHTWRFRVPAGANIEFDDLVRGPQRFAAADIGDFVIRRADGSAAFFFSNAVDDALMGVTHVLRGEDHLSNTPRQLLLLRALNLRAPSYGHVSLILGDDHAPLSKRHGSTSVEDLRAQGYLPTAVLNGLARLGHSYANTALLKPDELAAQFDLKHLGMAPAHFDERHFEHWQRETVLKEDFQRLLEWFGPNVARLLPSDFGERNGFVRAVRGNVLFPAEAEEWAKIIHTDLYPMTEEAKSVVDRTDKSVFVAAINSLSGCWPAFTLFMDKLKSVTTIRGKALFQPLRAAITGRLDGPEFASLFELMSEERIRHRLEQYL